MKHKHINKKLTQKVQNLLSKCNVARLTVLNNKLLRVCLLQQILPSYISNSFFRLVSGSSGLTIYEYHTTNSLQFTSQDTSAKEGKQSHSQDVTVIYWYCVEITRPVKLSTVFATILYTGGQCCHLCCER
jgi:hypothetical protein